MHHTTKADRFLLSLISQGKTEVKEGKAAGVKREERGMTQRQGSNQLHLETQMKDLTQEVLVALVLSQLTLNELKRLSQRLIRGWQMHKEQTILESLRMR